MRRERRKRKKKEKKNQKHEYDVDTRQERAFLRDEGVRGGEGGGGGVGRREKRECNKESKKTKKKPNLNIHKFVLLLVPVAPLLKGENYTKGPSTPSRELHNNTRTEHRKEKKGNSS